MYLPNSKFATKKLIPVCYLSKVSLESHHFLACDWIGDVSQRIDNFVNFVCDKGGQFVREFFNENNVSGFAQLLRVMGIHDSKLGEVLRK